MIQTRSFGSRSFVRLFAMFLGSAGLLAQSPLQIGYYSEASPPVISAALKLAQDTGYVAGPLGSAAPGILLVLDGALEPQRYRIVGGGGMQVVVSGGTDAGLVNGIHAFRLRLLKSGRPDKPLDQVVQIDVIPAFERRGVMVCPYRFGGQQDRDGFGTETWTITDWRKYIDFLRLLNANVLVVFPLGRMTHPTLWPETRRDELILDTLVEAMHYAQSVGMEFHYTMLLNEVPGPQWKHYARTDPSKLAKDSDLAWTGTSLSPWTARQEIALGQSHVLSKFVNPSANPPAVADGFVFMWNDGGAQDLSVATVGFPKGTGGDPVGFVASQMADVTARIESLDPTFRQMGRRFVFWGWNVDAWYHVFDGLGTKYQFWTGPFVSHAESPTASYGYRVRTKLRNNVGIDHILSVTRASGQGFMDELCQILGLAGPCAYQYPDPIVLSKAIGFNKVDVFLYGTHPERPRMMLPHPNLDYVCSERDEGLASGAEGITAYRLAPLGRRFSDYATLRLAEDRDLTASSVIEDYADYLLRGETTIRPQVVDALTTLNAARSGDRTNFGRLQDAVTILSTAVIPPHLQDLRDHKTLVDFTYWLYAMRRPGTGAQFAEAWLKAHAIAKNPANHHLLGSFTVQCNWQTEAARIIRDFAFTLDDGDF